MLHPCRRGLEPLALIRDPFDTLWGVTTLTTVGYGNVTPVTAEAASRRPG